MAFYGKLIGKNQRIKTFECECLKLFYKDKRFEAIYPGKNFDFNKQIILTYDTLHLIWGKNGFLQKGLDLNWGEFSKLATLSRSAYNNLKLQNYMKSIRELANTGLQTDLQEIYNTYNSLDKNITDQLEKECDDFSNIIESSKGFATGSLAFYSAAGISPTVLVFPLLAGFTNVTVAAIITGMVASALFALGITAAGIALTVAGITKIIKTVEENKLKQNLKTLTNKLTDLSKKLKNTNIILDKFTKVPNAIERFISNETKKYKTYCSKKYKKLKKILEKNSEDSMEFIMDGQKYIIAKMISNIKLDKAAFNESKFKKIKSQNGSSNSYYLESPYSNF